MIDVDKTSLDMIDISDDEDESGVSNEKRRNVKKKCFSEMTNSKVNCLSNTSLGVYACQGDASNAESHFLRITLQIYPFLLQKRSE